MALLSRRRRAASTAGVEAESRGGPMLGAVELLRCGAVRQRRMRPPAARRHTTARHTTLTLLSSAYHLEHVAA
jgi:hypothetical protein